MSTPMLTGLLIALAPLLILVGLIPLMTRERWRYAAAAAIVALVIAVAFAAIGRLYYRPAYQGPWTWPAVVVAAFLYVPVAEWAAVFATIALAVVGAAHRRQRWTRATVFAVAGPAGAVIGAGFAAGVVAMMFGAVSIELTPIAVVFAIVGACCGAACGLPLPFFLPALQSRG
ncbi:MAG TPA: hypothetical protein VFA27_12145 [Vicinamibacterales bacterium]|nr:hypothetical protein [Vicinamibacterales bacterium]